MAASLRGRQPGGRGTSTVDRLRVVAVRSENVVAEVGDSSGTQGKRDVHRWKPLPSNG
jgi:hypothetical protein